MSVINSKETRNTAQAQLDVATGAPKRNLLLIGLDGFRWEISQEPGVAPCLQTLAVEGRWHAMQMPAPTLSGPGWASILTGTTHAQHGVYDNSFIGKKLWQYPDFLAQAFYQDTSTRTFAAAAWPPLVDPLDVGPVIHPRREQQLAGLHHVLVRDGETHGYQRMDQEICDAAAAFLEQAGSNVGFVYFCGVDEAGHIYGLQDHHYRDAMRRVDAHMARLIEVLKGRKQKHGEEWLVVLTTDHGHVDAGGHGGNSDRERESWVLTWATDNRLPAWDSRLEPQQLCQLLLAAR